MSVSSIAAHHTTKTIYGIKNEMHSFVKIPYSPDVEMTLNYKYNNFANEVPVNAPTLRYFGIGIKGFYAIDDENGCQPFFPKETDADLYQPIPFRCVPISEDLSPVERSQYRMRVRTTVHGNPYYLYYLKVLEIVDSTVKVTQTDPTSGEELDYVMNPDNLYPKPHKPETSGTITGSVSEVNVSVTALLTTLGSEVTEAISVLYDGNMTKAKISEIGLYTGEDKILTGYDAYNNPFTYQEAVFAQLAAHHTNIGTDLSHPSSIMSSYLKITSGSIMIL